MNKQSLTKVQMNKIFHAFEEREMEFHLNKIKWTHIDQSSRMEYKDGNYKYFCEISQEDDRYYLDYFPSEDFVPFEDWIDTWDDVLSEIKKWIYCIQKEINAPDLWKNLAEMEEGSFVLGSLFVQYDIPIASAEADSIRNGIDNLKEKIQEEFSLNDDQIEVLNSRLHYLSQALNRQSKIDWMHTAIGVFVSIGIAIGVSASNRDAFWHTIKQAMGTTFRVLAGG